MSFALDRALGLPKGTLSAVRSAYARLPSVECKGLCHDSCGPIIMSGVEMAVLRHASGLDVLQTDDDLACPFLDPASRLCTQYENRPLICRAYGAVEGMPCRHGCKPRGFLSDAEMGKLIRGLGALSEDSGLPGVENVSIPDSQRLRLALLMGGQE